ncbi:MAG TPA: sulfite exporter TauE/SafE family protein [Alphaproteobacteria bacterium]|nr:sulfite exporter TauE/SafE family protein [Alphaproteobacteria bacterium]
MAKTILDGLYGLCTSSVGLAELTRFFGGLGLPAALFLIGLVGGLAHCTGMCGPFVLAQVAADERSLAGAGMSELRRLKGALLLPYQLGRTTTYVVLGALAGGGAGIAVEASGYRWLPAALLAFAAVLFLLRGVPGLTRWLAPAWHPVPLPGPKVPLARFVQPLFADPRGLRGWALGLALGFLPCGFLYSALAAAAGSGTAKGGAFAMAAFALGTGVDLVLVGYVGIFFGRRRPGLARALAPPLMLANAGFLAFLALNAVK